MGQVRVYTILWEHEDGESGVWVCHSLKGAWASIVENETVPAEDLEPDEDGHLDVMWSYDPKDGTTRAWSDDTGMTYTVTPQMVQP